MTASSPRGGRRRFSIASFDGLSSLPGMLLRDTLANNIMHAADEANAKVLVNWNAPDTSLITGTPQTYMAGDLEAAATWYRMAAYGPFGLSVKAGATPYTLVVEVEAKASIAAATQIAIEVGPLADLPHNIIDGTGRNSQQWNTSSTARAWLTSVSTSNLIVVDSSALSAVTARPTDEAGEPREIVSVEVYVNVFGWSTAGTAEPWIYGVHVREYVG